jgi:hypothetical protein
VTDRIHHPTGGAHTGVRSVKDAYGHRQYVYVDGGYGGRGVKDHAREPANWQSRNGVDIVVLPGTPVYAAFDGRIGDQFGPLSRAGDAGPESKFAGNRLTIEGKSDRAYYAHLSRYADGIGPGVTVKEGQLIGYSGTAGNVHHLHIAFQSGQTEQMLREAQLPPPAPTSTEIDMELDRLAPGDPPSLDAGPPAPEPGDTPPADMGAPGAGSPEAADAGVPAPERPDAGYIIPPPLGLTGGEYFDPDKAGVDVLEIESILLGLTPAIGILKGLWEGIDGHDLLTDRDLSVVNRIIGALPVVGMMLKEMANVARLEQVATEFRGADALSSSMREIAIASDNADLLLDSLLFRLEALKEMEWTAGAAEMLEIVKTFEKVAELVDGLADSIDLAGTLLGRRESAQPAAMAPAPPPPMEAAKHATPSDGPQSTPADANMTDADTGNAVRRDDVTLDVSTTPRTDDTADGYESEAPPFDDAIDFISLPAIDPSEAMSFAPVDTFDTGPGAGFDSAPEAGMSFDTGHLAGTAGDGFAQSISDFVSDVAHTPDLGHDGGVIIGGDHPLASFDPGTESGVISTDGPAHDGGTLGPDSGYTDHGGASDRPAGGDY